MSGRAAIVRFAATLAAAVLVTCGGLRAGKPAAGPPVLAADPAASARAGSRSASGAGGLDAFGLPESAIDAAVVGAMAAGQIPGAVVVIGRRDGVVFRRAYGFREVEPERVPMTLDTVFDLASLTKPIATATSIMALVERGAVGLDDPLVKYVPECASKRKAAITLRHLLLHVSGLPADIPKERFADGRAEALRRICDLALRGAPGTVSIYSDLGFILLEEVVRRVTSRDLASFAADAIFTPLGMHSTGFLPSDDLKRRAAWTEFVDGAWRAGVVHDPRAYLLGGIAGNAGLFSTADDVALYARAILGRGEVDGRRILAPRTVAAMIAPYDVPGSIRALGWNVQSIWRGEGLSPTAIGHFGFTGTAMWIDPDKDLFVVVLTNRVHPDGKGDSKPLVAAINTIAARAIGPRAGRVDTCTEAGGETDTGAAHVATGGISEGGGVWTGIDVLRDEGFARLRGMRVGLITNATGRARDGKSTIDLLRAAPGVSLVALFSPEHGLDGSAMGRLADGRDAATGLAVYSLYGDNLSPTDGALSGIDALVFDVQDVGTRFYTYASTMLRALSAAAAHDARFIVLDRPDPIDGVDVDGPVLVPPSRSFVNYHSLPVRHGMTIGELATLFNADDHLGAALSVVTMRGWKRQQYGDDTGLPWVNPSPNLRRLEQEILYPAIGLLEATNLSVGRGTDAPFERVGAPWIDGVALAKAVSAEDLGGIAVEPEVFTPAGDRYAGRECGGIRLTITDRVRFEAVRTGLAIARALRRAYPREWQFAKLDRLLVHPRAMQAIDRGLPLDAIVDTYRDELDAFKSKREKYLLYVARPCPSDRGRTGEPKTELPASRPALVTSFK